MRHLLVLPFALACSESNLSSLKDGGDGDGPMIEVTPDFLDYGTLGQSDGPVIQSFTVTSVGATDLEVDGVTIEGAAASSFAVVSGFGGVVLAPGESQVVEVAFAPLGANELSATAFVASNAQDLPRAPVDLLGRGAVPELQITPDPLDFGPSYVGCPKSLDATLTNVGGEPLVIDALDWGGAAELSFTHGLTLPYYLGVGESTLVTFGFSPSSDATFEGTLAVTSNEPLGVREHLQTGQGRYAGSFTDSFEVPVDPPSDILFAVDQSCSMDDDQSNLVSNFGQFITQLSGYSNDWQIVVSNDDDGCNRSGILRPSMGASAYTSAFSTAVRGGGGNHTESLLTVGAAAVEATNAGQCNYGFMRPEAMLHLILVSDEPEQSAYTSGQTWDQLVSRMIAAKGSASMVRVSAIAGPVPSGCSSADPGTGYAEAVAATGGVFLSICSNWASPSNLALLAEASINQDTYALTRVPVPSTIEVYHNGTLRSASDWTYDAGANSVTIVTNVPTEGDTVDITYGGAASCD
jgi:hypothetical protein